MDKDSLFDQTTQAPPIFSPRPDFWAFMFTSVLSNFSKNPLHWFS